MLAASDELRQGAAIVIADRRHRRGLLVRRTDGTAAAFAGTCTHEGCPVDYVAATHRFRCTCSGCEFDADDGSVVTGPAVAALPRWRVDESGGAIRLG